MVERGQAAIQVRGLAKRYGDTTVLEHVDMDVRAGEFLTLLGPSGSGKSTLLMIIAGFTGATAGTVLLDGRDIVGLPPHKRDLGVVFQSYALFPHMSVAENVAYPLRVRRIGRAERDERVKHALDLVRLGHLADRRISQISGGQRQRVALARAIVFEPRVILMDEPLSALDKKLREDMQVELREMHARLKMTTIYVTHDQREALTMSDRIAVMQHGRILQIDAPKSVYEKPADSFVASFMGDTTLFPVSWASDRLEAGGRPIRCTIPSDRGRAYYIVLRPERLKILAPDEDGSYNALSGTVADVVYLGDSLSVVVETESKVRFSIRHDVTGLMSPPMPGSPVQIGLGAGEVQIVPECVA
ncbi:ABC transporter ATP-binding protein [Bradyrhizobium liaoningense]